MGFVVNRANCRVRRAGSPVVWGLAYMTVIGQFWRADRNGSTGAETSRVITTLYNLLHWLYFYVF